MGTYQTCGLSHCLTVNLNALQTGSVVRWIVPCSPFATGAFEAGKLRWPDAPVTTRLPGYDMVVVMRRFLPAVHSVVLESEDPQWFVSIDQRVGNPLCKVNYSVALLV